MTKTNTLFFLLLACVNCSFAQIVYTDIVDKNVGINNLSEDIDFNLDGVADLTMNYNVSDHAIAIYDIEDNPMDAQFVGEVVIGAFLEVPINTALPLTNGDPIGDMENYLEPTAGGINNIFLNFWQEGVTFPTDQSYFVGCRFFINSEFHYAWIKVRMLADESIDIYEIAFESEPNQGINAGEVEMTSGLSEINPIEVSVYPNPTTGTFTLENKTEYSVFQVDVIRANGRLLETKKVESTNRTEVNIENLPAGFYLIRLTDDFGKQSYQKIVKE